MKSRKTTKKNTTLKGFFSKVNKTFLTVFLIIVALVAAAYLLKNQLIVATVNGKPITRFTLVSELEKIAGERALESLVTRTLILQEAKNQGVVISEEEIGNEIEKIKETMAAEGQDLDQLLSFQGLSMDEFRQQVKLQKIVEKIVGREVEISDEELNQAIDENKGFFPEETSEDEIKTNVRQQLEQEKIGQKVQTWLTDLQGKAKINYWLQL